MLAKYIFKGHFLKFLLFFKHNWKIWCKFLIVDGLVFDKIRQAVVIELKAKATLETRVGSSFNALYVHT